ncbi:glycosyltransferase family 1 protein [Gracilibacillus kekensis]|uniref:Glycosyltransferase involved in cell wall bisynthesis n=1 Tax=Gracilibacillus kekensis TaxID=1027249 RepID=A0A1M7PX60_9BACI|nr:glycosyltransferase family 1 protein [Gracilibacillus kekensis]SHN22205.1 Glycosyltransferase involved in cell wall bisynthesis [Gracilibacillus kekensis]
MESALRILHVVEKMNHGEIGTMLMNVYRNLDRSKVQFDFLTNAEGDYDEEIRTMGGHLYRIPSIDDVGIQGYKKALRHFFKGHRFYIVMHAHLDKMSSFSLKAAKRVGIPVRVVHSHNTGTEKTGKEKFLQNVAGSIISLYATHYFACSSEAAKWLFKTKAKNAEIIYNAIELERFCYSNSVREKVRQEIHISDKEFLIGHIGPFSPQKNHDYLIELFVGFRRRIPQAKLILIGDGPLRKKIEEKIKQYHIVDHVIFLNVKEDIERWMQAFDLFLYPSLHEGLPMTLIEAQSAGLPILASDHIPREVDLRADLIEFIQLNNKREWLEKMYESYEKKNRNPVDAEVLIKKGYDVKQVARQTEQKYLQLRDDGI